jgi:hypothetical protein
VASPSSKFSSTSRNTISKKQGAAQWWLLSSIKLIPM